MSEYQLLKNEICRKLFEYKIIKFGEFTLKSGKTSNVYFDLRLLCSHPDLLNQVISCYHTLLTPSTQSTPSTPQLVCGVAYTGIPLATAYSLKCHIPMIFRRKESKNYGLKKMLEGEYHENQHLILLDDVITSGTSIFETLPDLLENKLIVDDICVLIDRRPPSQQTPYLEFNHQKFKFHSVFTADEIFQTLNQMGYQIPQNLLPTPSPKLLSQVNSIHEKLHQIMTSKKTNLILSADVPTFQELKDLVLQVHPHICVLKLHADILQDATLNDFLNLHEFAQKNDFLLMEDRKFADIGNTCRLQYTYGPHQIIQWADLVTFQTTMGQSTIQGLDEAIQEYQKNNPDQLRGLVPIIEASTPGNLIKTDEGLNLISSTSNIVAIVSQKRPKNLDSNLFVMTPGVNLATNQDNLGQKYRTPEDAILKQNCDLIIVGRGIYQAENPGSKAQEYQQVSWEAYHTNINKSLKIKLEVSI